MYILDVIITVELKYCLDVFLFQMMPEMECLLKIFSSYGIDPNTSKVLDIGCGNGKFTLELAKVFQEVLGIDSSSEVINNVRKAALRQNIKNLSLKLLDPKELHTLGENRFNVIITRNVKCSYKLTVIGNN